VSGDELNRRRALLAEAEFAALDGDESARDQESPKKRGPTQSTLLVDLALSLRVDLFHTPDGVAYANVEVGGHRETWPIRTGPFRRWLARRYYEQEQAVPSAQPMQDALGVLEGRALFDGAEHPVFTRLGSLDEKIYLDLGDDQWRVVEITATGWQVVDAPPVFFRRPSGLLALPVPVRGGSIDELREFVNVTDDDWPLLVGWLVHTFRPTGPYVILILHGEQGTAKSTTARVLRALVDPNVAALRTQPRHERDLAITARNGWLLAFDNLSDVPDWLSDAFCRLSTGGGLATRRLYTDDDEMIFDAQRPQLLTGIEEVATRGDLLDRALIEFLPAIGDSERRSEDEFWPAFEAARPRLLGALLVAASNAQAGHRSVRLEAHPRMADFARWVVAAEQAPRVRPGSAVPEPGLGWPEGTFLDAYTGKRAEAHELTLEASVVAPYTRDLAGRGFFGTATELLRLLNEQAGEDLKELHKSGWPKDARRLSGALRRIAPDLRAVGVEIEFGLGPKKRDIELRMRRRSNSE
jgi:hypothetical protein